MRPSTLHNRGASTMRSHPAPLLLAFLIGLGASPAAMAQTPAAPAPAAAAVDPHETEEARRARLKWFHEAKYGLFIHWGLYAIPEGVWKGKEIPGIGEWIMNRAKIPVKEYEQLAKQWNPTKFNAE